MTGDDEPHVVRDSAATGTDGDRRGDDRARPWQIAAVGVLALVAGGIIYWAVSNGGTKAAPVSYVPSAGTTSHSSQLSPSPPDAPADGYTFSRRTQDIAAAKRINLRLADMPAGWAADTSDTSADTSSADQQMADCLGEPASEDDDVNVDSPNFTDATLSVQSSVEFAHTLAAARHDLAVVRDPHTLDCLNQSAGSALADAIPDATLESANVEALSTAPLADGSFGFRVACTLSVGNRQVPVYVDVVGFLAGRAEVTGTFSSVGVSLPGPIETRFMAIMAQRATGVGGSGSV